MSSPISTRGVRRLMDGLVDEISQATRRAARSDARLETHGLVEVRGRYSIDESGELVISGKASALVGGAPVAVEAGADRRSAETGHGDGDLLVRLEVRVRVGGGPELPFAAPPAEVVR